jgi:hypothetical protein
MKIENFLKNLSLEELVEVRNLANNLIDDYSDGYFYICEIRSYGRAWKSRPTNIKAVSDLCYEYDGEHGIIDVYSNNPSLSSLYTYGRAFYIPTEADYEKWKSYSGLRNRVPKIEEEWEVWDNRDDMNFRERPIFAPIYSKEDLVEMKKELEDFPMDFTQPVLVNYSEEGE